jgi:hypothetical protein
MQNIHCFPSAIGNYGDGNSILCLTAWSSNYHAPRQLIGAGSLSLPVPIIYFLPISSHSAISTTCNPNNGLRVFFCSPYTSYIFSISLTLSNAYRNKHKCLFSISSILFPHSRKEKHSKDKNVKSSYSYFLTEFFQARWL